MIHNATRIAAQSDVHFCFRDKACSKYVNASIAYSIAVAELEIARMVYERECALMRQRFRRLDRLRARELTMTQEDHDRKYKAKMEEATKELESGYLSHSRAQHEMRQKEFYEKTAQEQYRETDMCCNVTVLRVDRD